jgi:hypothetical protein
MASRSLAPSGQGKSVRFLPDAIHLSGSSSSASDVDVIDIVSTGAAKRGLDSALIQDIARHNLNRRPRRSIAEIPANLRGFENKRVPVMHLGHRIASVFQSQGGAPAPFLERGLCPQITGIVVDIFRDLEVRDRRRLPQSSRDILRRQREDEGNGVVGTGAVSKAEAANIAALSNQVELLRHWLRHGASACDVGDRVPTSRARNRARFSAGKALQQLRTDG